VTTPANTHRPTQPTSDALAIWERAAKENKPIGLDGHGNVTMLSGASHESLRGPASHRQTAKDAILSKMRSEMAQRGSWNGSAIHNVMASHLPSLDGFMRDDQVSYLRSEWNNLRKTTEASLELAPDVVKNRLAVAERITPFLPPGLGISLHDDGVSWLKHIFSDKQQQKILGDLASLGGDQTDLALHLDSQMLKDLGRNMMTSLSNLTNQKSVLKLVAAHQAELPPASGTEIHIHANSKKMNSLSLYRLRLTNEGDIHLMVSHMKKGSALLDDQMRTLFRLKPG
jgi:hypothetical protein